MTTSTERDAARIELVELEARLRVLLGVVDDPRSGADAVEHAAAAAERPLDAVRLVAIFAGAPEPERKDALARVARLCDLNAMLHDATARSMTRTTDALERARALKAQIDSADVDDETSGVSLDCTH